MIIFISLLYRTAVWGSMKGRRGACFKTEVLLSVNNTFTILIATPIGGRHFFSEIKVLICPYCSERHYFCHLVNTPHIKESLTLGKLELGGPMKTDHQVILLIL